MDNLENIFNDELSLEEGIFSTKEKIKGAATRGAESVFGSGKVAREARRKREQAAEKNIQADKTADQKSRNEKLDSDTIELVKGYKKKIFVHMVKAVRAYDKATGETSIEKTNDKKFMKSVSNAKAVYKEMVNQVDQLYDKENGIEEAKDPKKTKYSRKYIPKHWGELIAGLDNIEKHSSAIKSKLNELSPKLKYKAPFESKEDNNIIKDSATPGKEKPSESGTESEFSKYKPDFENIFGTSTNESNLIRNMFLSLNESVDDLIFDKAETYFKHYNLPSDRVEKDSFTEWFQKWAKEDSTVNTRMQAWYDKLADDKDDEKGQKQRARIAKISKDSYNSSDSGEEPVTKGDGKDDDYDGTSLDDKSTDLKAGLVEQGFDENTSEIVINHIKDNFPDLIMNNEKEVVSMSIRLGTGAEVKIGDKLCKYSNGKIKMKSVSESAEMIHNSNKILDEDKMKVADIVKDLPGILDQVKIIKNGKSSGGKEKMSGSQIKAVAKKLRAALQKTGNDSREKYMNRLVKKVFADDATIKKNFKFNNLLNLIKYLGDPSGYGKKKPIEESIDMLTFYDVDIVLEEAVIIAKDMRIL